MPLRLLPRGCPRHKFVPVLTTGNSYEVVGPDGASVHIYPRDDLDFFSGFDLFNSVNQNRDGAGINSPYGKVK
ncbi:hypothetical protein FIU93_00380 [Labrenzia sp. THAF35]|nr:hypothetical protein FIU93_00380 [Labrenzia sp. THAF35]